MKQIFGLIFWISMTTWGMAAVGIIQQYRGSVQIVRGTHTLHAKKYLKLEAKDIIRTGRQGWVQIALTDKTRITAGKNSELVIQDYLYDKSSRSKVSLGFTRGVFRALSGAIGKVARKNFKVHTPTATIGIRGTRFYVRVSRQREQVFCTRGAIVFDNGHREIIVKAGHQILFDLVRQSLQTGKIPTKALKTLQGDLKTAPKRPAPKNRSGLVTRSQRGVLKRHPSPQRPVDTVRTHPFRHIVPKRRIKEQLHEQTTSKTIDNIKPIVQHPCDKLIH